MLHVSTFWDTLPRPILGLAPMDGITDHPFRHIQKKHGRPHVLYTEFTSVTGPFTRDGRLLRSLLYDESQRPILGQIYGRSPAPFRQMAILLCQLGFDGIDINMGCPTRSVAHSGAGAGLIKTPQLAQEIVRAVKSGIEDWCNGASVRDCPSIPPFIKRMVESRAQMLPLAAQVRRPLPVSIKTRVGYDAPQVDVWIPQLLETKPTAIAIHGRSLRQAYGGFADWDAIAQATELARGSGVLILGNGDVQSFHEAQRRISACGVDGVLIGRAACGNPFVFAPPTEEDLGTRCLQVAIEHVQRFERAFHSLSYYHFVPMRKHLAWYARHASHGAALRRELLQVHTAADALNVLHRALERQVESITAGMDC
jgi:tRNA-dihydrouridine synthase